MNDILISIRCLAFAATSVLLVGCRQSAPSPGGAKSPPPEVTVIEAVGKEVQDYEEFPGRLEAVNSVEIRARVTGFLNSVTFKEGTTVKVDDVLFEIDPRLYETELKRTEGSVQQMTGRLTRLEADLLRANNLLNARSLSREDYEKLVGDRTEAQGLLEVAKADVHKAKIHLGWTKVKAPLSGRIGRRMVDPGNLVKADETVLTNIVDLDPMYVYFDIDERSAVKFRKMVQEGAIEWSPEKGLPLQYGLVDEQSFPRKGVINFVDNRIDADTGTWRLRATVENRDLNLTPGLFVNIRLPLGAKHSAVLVPEQALGADQGQRFVYIVGSTNVVEYRRVSVGRQHGSLREITKGLAEGERVIINGLQRARPGIEVQTVAP
jgi:RND family efflux transporter MFP subunit